MRSINDEWRLYRDQVYPKGVPANQNRECHRAFMAGAHAALCAMTAATDRPDEADAAQELQALADECAQFGKQVGLKG